MRIVVADHLANQLEMIKVQQATRSYQAQAHIDIFLTSVGTQKSDDEQIKKW